MKLILLSSILIVTQLPLLSEAILPVVAWHGLGMSCCQKDSTMWHYLTLFKNITNGSYIKSIMIGLNEEEDKLNSFVMPADAQVDMACAMLRFDKRLHGGYNALGASQGSQLLRAVAQRCPFPPMRTLVTLGGQHQGVFGIPGCDGKYGPANCDVIRRAVSPILYSDIAQDFEYQAEYWHDPYLEPMYRAKNRFMADINQEQEFIPSYKENLLKLRRFVLVKYLQDTTVIPRESEWFGFYPENRTDTTYRLQDSKLYKEDLLGLQEMDKRGDLIFLSYNDGHCSFTDEWFTWMVHTYFMD